MAREKTLLERIQDLQWYDAIGKLRSILKDILSNSSGTQDLASTILIQDLPYIESTSLGNNLTFNLAQRAQYTIFYDNVGATVTLNDAVTKFPVYSVLRFETYENDLIFQTTDDVRHLGNTITNYVVKKGEVVTLKKIDTLVWILSTTKDYINIANDFSNDAAAALGGISVGELYHKNGAVQVRLT